MNFKELNEKLGGLEIESNWRRAIGGGWINKSAKVSDEKLIQENGIVYGQVSGDARVSGDAQVYGNARVSGNAKVSGDAWAKSPLFIIGSKFSLTNTNAGYIQIGCKCETFAWWKKNGLSVAKEQGFTAEEIVEYRAYINLFCKIGK